MWASPHDGSINNGDVLQASTIGAEGLHSDSFAKVGNDIAVLARNGHIGMIVKFSSQLTIPNAVIVIIMNSIRDGCCGISNQARDIKIWAKIFVFH